MEHTYWHRQTAATALYPDIEWAKPEQRSLAGKLLIVGGNKLGFLGVAESYQTAQKAGVGEVRVVLPDVLRKAIPPVITDTVFASSNPSGGLSQEALPELEAAGHWASGVLLIGDAGRNSETAIVYENFISSYNGPLTITRDAVDLVKNSTQLLVERPQTLLVLSFAQLQKLFQAVYYPKVLTFSMQLSNLVEALHKFTITYPVSIVVLHQESLLVAYEGEVSSTPWQNPMAIWRGTTATNAAAYWLWNKEKTFQSVTASVLA